jgi:hypothetical protein
MASPLMISIGLHYWTSPGDYAENDPEHANSPAVRDCIDFMLDAGMLRPNDDTDKGRRPAKYRATDALKAWVLDGLCEVPFPERTWIIPWKRDNA